MHSDESTRRADFNWAIKLNRLALNIVGLWPNYRGNACDNFLSNLRVAFCLLVFVFVGVIPAFHVLLKSWGDMMSIIDNLQFTLPLLTTIMKLLIIWWKKNDLTLVISMIADDWMKVKTNKELQVMLRRARNARAITAFGYIFMTIGFSLLVFLPCFGMTLRYVTNITDPVKILPLQTDYIYDKNRSPYFELTFAAQSLLLILAAASYTGIDNLIGLAVFHLCGQMENLRERLIKMKEFSSDLAYIVKDHIRLIKFFYTIEGMFNLLLLGLLFNFSALFCLQGFLIITIFTENRDISMLRLIYLISVILNIGGHTCLYCVVGEVLVTQCEGIYNAVYDYKWYTLEPEKARTLILIMIRASKPLYITAGRIFPMTMSMFCNLIKTSSGYISVLVARQGLQK